MTNANDHRPTTALFRHLKIHPAIVVHPGSSIQVQLRERNLLPGLVVIEHPERSTSNRIIPYFLNMLVAENQRRRGDGSGPFLLARLRAARIHILIPFPLPIVLLAQPLFFDAQRVHLAGQRKFAILIIVIRGRRVRPPVRIVVASVAVSAIPRIPETPPATEAVMKTAGVKAPAAKTVSAEGRMREGGMSAQSGVHSAEGVADRSSSHGASNAKAVTAARRTSNRATATGTSHATALR
jgi:hypothetical protein